jgi:diguanylate cyclase (GGDEF)-like protein
MKTAVSGDHSRACRSAGTRPGHGKKVNDTRKRLLKPATILRRIMIPLLVTAVVQSGLIVALMIAYGVFTDLRENALNSLNECSRSKQQNLEAQMAGNWFHAEAADAQMLDIVTNTLLQDRKDFQDIQTDADLNEKILDAAVPALITRIRNNNANGVFLILNGSGNKEEPDAFAGVYLRDTAPGEDEANDADISVLRGSHLIFQNTGLLQDKQWRQAFTFPGGAENAANGYFYQTLNAALNGGIKRGDNAGYWLPSFTVEDADIGDLMAYCQPLFNRQGEAYGVLGFALDKSILRDLLGTGEFTRSGRGFFFLGITRDGGLTYEKVVSGGSGYQRFFNETDGVLTAVGSAQNGRITVLSTLTGDTLHGAVQNLDLYAENSPFSGSAWVLIGMEDEPTLFAFVYTARNVILTAAILAALIGVAVSALAGRRMVRPIIRLVNSLKTSDPNEGLTFERTSIKEINHLADAITTLNNNVIESATRLTKILKLAGLSAGVFEIRNDSDTAYCSDEVFTLLGREDLYSRNNRIPKAVCLDMVERAAADPAEESVFRLYTGENERFVRIRRLEEQNGSVGAIFDVTAEMENRRRLERERDYDLLTGILNRRAFESDANGLFAHKNTELGVTALIMLDLDNLKYLNDTYGHDCGDGYIRTFAESLRLFGSENALVARRSGDEFLVLLYGGQEQNRMRMRIKRAWEGILTSAYTLPDGSPYHIRVSAGVAWYPNDADTLAQLIHLADFAMYRAKRNAKGTFVEFNAQDYNEDSFLASGRNALNRMIDGQMVRFAVQPILSAKTGETVGYELLMRSDVQELPDPQTVLRLAGTEGKLSHIERLTWFKGLETADKVLEGAAAGEEPPMLFLNSIANEALNGEDERLVEKTFGVLLHRLVVEVTESERNDLSFIEQKTRFVKNHGGKIAIDDYGTGGNSELALVKIAADIVKLDISVVHGVDTDEKKQALVRNLIGLARQRKVAVLAEGVETAAEMNTLIRFGVDYLQGYYFGRPQYQPVKVSEMLMEEIRQAYAGRGAKENEAELGNERRAPH